MAKARGDFTDNLLRRQILSPDQLEEARGLANQTGAKIQDALDKLGYATKDQIMSAIAEFHGMQFVDLTDVVIPAAIIELVPESMARENIVLPLAEENGALKIVLSDPSDFETLQKLQFVLQKDLQPVLAPREQIIEAINRHYGQTETESVDSMLQEFTDTAIDFTETEQTAAGGETENNEAPVVKLCNLIIQEAVSLRASDIHIEPFADRIRIRYRIDGILVERDSAPRRLLAPLLSRYKIMARMDIAEKRRPQDGRIKMNLQNKHYDLRVSMLPTSNGQSCVMRILDRGNIQISIKDLGFAEDDYARFQQIVKRPNGIFLVTGPTARSSPRKTRSSITCPASTSARSSTTSASTSRPSSAPCCGRRRTSSSSAKSATRRRPRSPFRRRSRATWCSALCTPMTPRRRSLDLWTSVYSRSWWRRRSLPSWLSDWCGWSVPSARSRTCRRLTRSRRRG